MTNTINITSDVIEKLDKDRMFDLLVVYKLPISQAIAYHLMEDKGWKGSDAGRLLGVSQIAISDARYKARKKMEGE